MLQYKTKGNVSPQGKRRVYFTCHPDDYDRFFDRISTDILKFSDSAIWINPDDNYEDIDTDLGQMNLFVIPITTKLLTKPCRAINIDVPFALEKHIPILPLMQEGGLDELFTRYFGDLQYLDPNTHDITAISYEEKLKKYLNSVLVSDEMAEKVRAAFDAYIFLSYRKKDRKYANELMRLIHKNDFCRDIAIWYDEFLVPGEDFNDAISDALKKSDLFTMVVTPNLINEKNYVQTVEYPEAVKQNKIIIPTELEKTDYKSLSEKYPNIPNSINAHDKNALSDALQAALINIARRENDNDPQHNFFIGFAYLEGIDVEVDHKRALELITSAAEAKENRVPEAIEKLVAMYKEGYGVERNYQTAVEWQRKLFGYYSENFKKLKKNPNISLDVLSHTYNKLNKALLDLIDLLVNDLKDFTEARNYCLVMLPVTEQIAKQNESFRFTLAMFYEKMGDICQALGNQNEAEKFYKEVLNITEQILNNSVNETEIIILKRALSLIYVRLGDLYLEQKDLKRADEFYHKGVLISELIVKNTECADFRRNLSVVYGRLGHLCKECEDQKGAEDFYLKELTITEQLAEEINNEFWRRDLSDVYDNLGNYYIVNNNLEKAKEFYEKALTLRELLLEEADTLDDRRGLAFSYSHFGDLFKTQGNQNKAKEFYEKSLMLFECLEKKIGTVESRYDLAYSYRRIGELSNIQNNQDEAENYFKKALVILKCLTEENGSVKVRNELSICYTYLGDINKSRGNQGEATKFYRECLSLREQVAKETKNVEHLRNLLVSCGRLGDFYKTYNDFAGAEE